MIPYEPLSAGKLKALVAEVISAQRPAPNRVHGRWRCPSATKPGWTKSACISSLTTATSYAAASRAVSASSAPVHTRPVGLWGEQRTSTLLSARASCRSSAAMSPTGTPRSSRPRPDIAFRKPSYVGVWTTTPSPGSDHIRSSWESWLSTDGPYTTRPVSISVS